MAENAHMLYGPGDKLLVVLLADLLAPIPDSNRHLAVCARLELIFLRAGLGGND